MRQKAWWGTTAATAVCMVYGLAAAGEKDTYQSAKAAAAESKARAEAASKESRSWWWPFGSSEAEIEKPRSAPKVSTPPRLDPTTNSRLPETPEVQASSVISKEQAKFLRRQQVCDRLREIAQETGDRTLEKQAQLLEQRAWFIYEQRTSQARLPSLLPLDDRDNARKLTAPTARNDVRGSDRPVRSVIARSPENRDGKE